MKEIDILSILSDFPVVPVFSSENSDEVLHVAKCCYSGGIPVFEFTKRKANAEAVFTKLVSYKELSDNLILGVGSILNGKEAKRFIDLGAKFIVSPILDLETANVCLENNIPWIPGCATLTEIITATRNGAKLVKIFPGNVLGPSFVSAILGPCPDLKLMPTGGVKPEMNNLKAWFDAGVIAVGMGSTMFTKEMIDMNNAHSLLLEIERLKKIIETIRS